jgi:hypothetical protein
MGTDNPAFTAPKKGDRVGAVGHDGLFDVVEVHSDPNLVDLTPVKGGPVQASILWAALMFTDIVDPDPPAVKEAAEGG